MKHFFFATLVVMLLNAGLAQSSPHTTEQAVAPQIVDVRSGDLRLKGYLWKPTGAGPFPAVLFNHGSGGTDSQHTAGRTMAEAAAVLAPVFLEHGYVFFYLCRRGQGLSADQGAYTQDLVKQAEAKGPEARKLLHYQLVTGSQLDDALAGLAFLKTVPGVDAKRIAIVGHSFGGMLTLLSGEHDSSIRAEVSFAAGANAWHASQELRQRILASVDKTSAPIMLSTLRMTMTPPRAPRSLPRSSASTGATCSRSIPRLAKRPTMATACCIWPCLSGNRMCSGFSMPMSKGDRPASTAQFIFLRRFHAVPAMTPTETPAEISDPHSY